MHYGIQQSFVVDQSNGEVQFEVTLSVKFLLV